MLPDHYLIPAQVSGAHSNIGHTVHAPDIDDAEDWFVDAKEKLLDVNNWSRYCLAPGINFCLVDVHGRPLHRKAHKADYIDIQNAASLQFSSQAMIEAIEYDDYPDISMETFAMRIRLCTGLQAPSCPPLAGLATATIVIERIGKRLSSSFHGRNEPNANVSALAFMGLSEIQLANMMKGFID